MIPNLLSELLPKWLDALPFASFVTTSDNHIIYANQETEHLLREMVLDTSVLDLQYLLGIDEARTDADPVYSPLRVGDYVTKSVLLGTPPRSFLLRATCVQSTDGETFFCCALPPKQLTDDSNFRELLDDVSAMVVQLDLTGRISYVNREAKTVLKKEAEGFRHLRDLDRKFTDAQWENRAAALRAGERVIFQTDFAGSEEPLIPVQVSIVADRCPLRGRHTLTAQDMTRHRAAEHRSMNPEYRWEGETLNEKESHPAGPREMVSAEPSYLRLLSSVDQVAPTLTTILITGETGTGKELIARRIHALSERADRPLITVDCGALPAGLSERELFGYRRGAFTGADTDRPGLLQAAHLGTLFLDEIGSLPLKLQSRLLRVLQEGTFTPLGDHRSSRVDVRVIASSNRDLRKEVDKGTFRSDLFYRLNVFPVYNPPLRERRADILPLVYHFIQRHNSRLKRSVTEVAPEVIDLLSSYNFPGNVRELGNLVERALILSTGHILRAIDFRFDAIGTGFPIQQIPVQGTLHEVMPLEELQKRYIRHVLQLTGGKVSGPRGAAELLKINPQTLYGRMRKFGLR